MAQTFDHTTGEIPKPQTKIIWRTFWILLGLTALEFLIAFTVPANTFRVGVFVLLTIAKAFYIVAEFMHLRHEVKFLIWTIVLPMLFIAWLLIALLTEGASLFSVIFGS
ncbi:cytochrome C oxidase subunit IV family protein [Eisenibacter elegans]|jgi:cytochrome c oxidase subunit IV|uniref:cytochrome C oxidase subunit IV family protein n=1 Tax=Eisenibacter elegans TaxID=997 RepID=UPI000411F59F|nr:cytochrome C oxidase subunit IV family protein [Eisenibacter elegans]